MALLLIYVSQFVGFGRYSRVIQNNITLYWGFLLGEMLYTWMRPLIIYTYFGNEDSTTTKKYFSIIFEFLKSFVEAYIFFTTSDDINNEFCSWYYSLLANAVLVPVVFSSILGAGLRLFLSFEKIVS